MGLKVWTGEGGVSVADPNNWEYLTTVSEEQRRHAALNLKAIEKQFEMQAQYEENKLVEHSVYQTVRDIMSDEWIVRSGCGTWLCNSCEDTGGA